MNTDKDLKQALRRFFDRETDRLIDQGIPPQPDDEDYVVRFQQSVDEHVVPEVLKREDWTRQIVERWLSAASPAQLREVAWKALERGDNRLAEYFEGHALLRQVEEWIIEEIKALEAAGSDNIGIKEVVQNVLAKHSDEIGVTEAELTPLVRGTMRRYFEQT